MNPSYNSIEQILDDPKFQVWAQSDFDPKDGYWKGHADGPQKDLIEEAVYIKRQLQFDKHHIDSDAADTLLARINKTIDNQDFDNIRQVTPPRKKSIFRRILIPAAAAVLLLIAAEFVFKQQTTYTTQNALTEIIGLPDQSRINLNAASQLSFENKKYDKSERHLTLDGEAFFEVEKGKPFIVETSNGFVEVLGTSFNVKNRDNLFEVSCKTGKVKVSNKSKKSSVILTAGQSCHLEAEDIKFINQNFPADEWTKGVFHFNNTDLVSVVRALERQYDIKIELDKNLNQPYTGFFEKGNLDKALSSIFWTLNLSYERVADNRYIIKAK